MRQLKMKQDIVLEDRTPRSDSSQSATGEKTDTGSAVLNDKSGLKLKGHSVVDGIEWMQKESP